jgi:hypothetical protein
VLDQLGQRRTVGRYPNPVTVTGLSKTTAQIAKEAGMRFVGVQPLHPYNKPPPEVPSRGTYKDHRRAR